MSGLRRARGIGQGRVARIQMGQGWRPGRRRTNSRCRHDPASHVRRARRRRGRRSAGGARRTGQARLAFCPVGPSNTIGLVDGNPRHPPPLGDQRVAGAWSWAFSLIEKLPRGRSAQSCAATRFAVCWWAVWSSMACYLLSVTPAFAQAIEFMARSSSIRPDHAEPALAHAGDMRCRFFGSSKPEWTMRMRVPTLDLGQSEGDQGVEPRAVLPVIGCRRRACPGIDQAARSELRVQHLAVDDAVPMRGAGVVCIGEPRLPTTASKPVGCHCRASGPSGRSMVSGFPPEWVRACAGRHLIDGDLSRASATDCDGCSGHGSISFNRVLKVGEPVTPEHAVMVHPVRPAGRGPGAGRGNRRCGPPGAQPPGRPSAVI